MSPWTIVGLVAIVSFGLGFIIGCLLMTKDDIIPEKKKTEKETRSNSQEITEVTGK